MKFLISQSPPVTLLGANTFLSTLFLNTFNLCSSLNVKDQVSYPYKTTSKIIFPYILDFTYLDSEMDSRLNGSKHFLNLICPNWGLKWRLKGHFFYERSQEVFGQLHNYRLKTLLHYNAKLGREDNFKQTTGNARLHEDSNNNGVRVANCATMRTPILRPQCSCIKTFVNNLDLSWSKRYQSDLSRLDRHEVASKYN